MEKPRPKETVGVPWADHNETESSPPDPRQASSTTPLLRGAVTPHHRRAS
jgi:hypothetical protein